MPPPVVQCVICKQEVMKARTYALKDGTRACKCHKGVVRQKDERIAAEKLQKEQELKRKAEYFKRSNEVRDVLCNRCWACKRTALTRQDFSYKFLVASERMDIKKLPKNPFDPEFFKLIRKEMGVEEGKKILITDLYPREGNEKAIAKLPAMVQTLSQIANMVSLCQDCSTNLQMKPFPHETPDFSFEKLAQISAIYEVVLKPEVRKEAVRELTEEAEKN